MNAVHTEQYNELINDSFRACVLALCGNNNLLLESQIAKVSDSMRRALTASIERKDAAAIARIKYSFGAMIIILTTDDAEEITAYLSPESLTEIGIKCGAEA